MSGFGSLVKEIYQQTKCSGESPRQLERLKHMMYQERLLKQLSMEKTRIERNISVFHYLKGSYSKVRTQFFSWMGTTKDQRLVAKIMNTKNSTWVVKEVRHCKRLHKEVEESLSLVISKIQLVKTLGCPLLSRMLN